MKTGFGFSCATAELYCKYVKGVALSFVTCNGEVIIKYSSASLPHHVMIFGRDVMILVKDNTLLRSFRIVTSFDAISSDGLLTCVQIMQ